MKTHPLLTRLRNTLAHRRSILLLSAVLIAGCNSSEGFKSIKTLEPAGPIHSFYESQPVVPELDENATLDDYLAYAAANNPGLESAFNKWKAAVMRLPQAKSLPDPRLQFMQYVQSIETKEGPIDRKFTLSQTFPWFGKLALQEDIAAKAAKAAAERFEAKRLALFYQVKKVYYEYYYLQQAIDVVGANLKLLTHFETIARANFDVGKASHADVIRAQVEMGQLTDRLAALKDMETPVRAELNAALNRPTDAPLVPPKIVKDTAYQFTDQAAIAALQDHNPELAALQFLADKEHSAVERAKKDYYPDVTFGLDYTQIGEGTNSSSGKDAVGGILSLNLPIWREKYKAGVEEARNRQMSVTKERVDKENKLSSDLQLVLYKYRDADRKIDLYRDALVPKAMQSLRVTQQGFEAGKASFLDLIDAERSLLEFQLSYQRALADKVQRQAEIEKLIGGIEIWQQITAPQKDAEHDAQDPGKER